MFSEKLQLLICKSKRAGRLAVRVFWLLGLNLFIISVSAQGVDTTKRPPPPIRDTTRNISGPERINLAIKLNLIFPSDDAIELIKLLNPGLSEQGSVSSNSKIIMPEFPLPDDRNSRRVNSTYRDDLKSDPNINASFADIVVKLGMTADIFLRTKFTLNNSKSNVTLSGVKRLLPLIMESAKLAVQRIKKASKKTIGTLTIEVGQLNERLEVCNGKNDLSIGDLNHIYTLMYDINILLFPISDKRLKFDMDEALALNDAMPSAFSYASYNIAPVHVSSSIFFDETNPVKFNIYIFRRQLVVNENKRSPEMGIYEIKYVIPAFANDPKLWHSLDERASTIHYYFERARFKFSITNITTQQTYYADVKLYNSPEDEKTAWRPSEIFRNTYKLIFLITD